MFLCSANNLGDDAIVTGNPVVSKINLRQNPYVYTILGTWYYMYVISHFLKIDVSNNATFYSRIGMTVKELNHKA